jgi:hypothetical protein
MSASEIEMGTILAEIERLLECLQKLPDSQPGHGNYPYFRASEHWERIAAVVKDSAEWLSVAGAPSAFASKPWLQLQLSGDRRAARHWPIDDVVRDLRFVQTMLLRAEPRILHSVSAAAEPSSRLARKPARRNRQSAAIDKALREFAEALPKNHEEVFRQLDNREVAILNRQPFKSAGGWLAGFRQNRHLASSWLSQVWGRLGLPAFRRGPKK